MKATMKATITTTATSSSSSSRRIRVNKINNNNNDRAVIKFKDAPFADVSSSSSGEEEEWTTSRRALLAGKAGLVLCEATIFPWLSEFYTRPKGGGILDGFDIPRANDDIRPFSRAFFESLLPAEYSEYDVLRAKECLKTGEGLMGEEKWDQAIVSLQQIEKLIPREYKMNQKAKLLIADCYKALGAPQYFNEEYLEAKGSVWWWGRGLRWPGWYIIAYLGARHVFFESKNDKVGEASITEGILISVLGISYLMLLNQFGLPDL
jgi:hypothetical protein